ncbi:MAG: PEGA domain-containing protein [Spirochaetes bacterium]|nr:PEGA domain-containing protein [Spirochaetota bacterium]
MSNKLIFIFHFIIYCNIFIFSTTGLNNFLERNDSPLLNELFTVNIGIMKLKTVGNPLAVNPVDRQNVMDSFKNVLEKVPVIKLSRKAAVLKALKVYISKVKDADKEKGLFLERRLLFSGESIDKTLVYELFLEFRKNKEFYSIAKQWFENLENPFYVLNISKPFDRIIKSEDKICDIQKVNNKGQLDYLIYGEIEKIDNLYFITIFIYSCLLQKTVKEFSFVSDSENITEKSMNSMSSMIPSIFLINYASLSIDTTDDQVRFFLDSDYIGREKVFIEFLVPGKYVVKLTKENYQDRIENINLYDFEEKKLSLRIAKQQELQVVDFYIEPLGTKIFINSVFQGRSPFKKALPKGNYIISAKNDLYESHRYIFSINEIKEEESSVVFHLKSKDVKNYFKLKKTLYYTAFWNLTFSLITAVPLIVFAKYFYDKFGAAKKEYFKEKDKQFINTKEGANMFLARNVLYGFAAAMVVHTGLSLGVLFFTLANYLITLEKKDFIPILDYYYNLEGREEITVGMKIKF